MDHVEAAQIGATQISPEELSRTYGPTCHRLDPEMPAAVASSRASTASPLLRGRSQSAMRWALQRAHRYASLKNLRMFNIGRQKSASRLDSGYAVNAMSTSSNKTVNQSAKNPGGAATNVPSERWDPTKGEYVEVWLWVGGPDSW